MSRGLDDRQVRHTAAWLAAQQTPSGELPWSSNGKMDPWDHVQAAMGLTAVGLGERARAAFRYLARTQEPRGGWAAERRHGRVIDPAQETNHAAYLATGLWHLHRHRPDPDFLAEMWPTLERAIDFVVELQLPDGTVAWAERDGRVWDAPLMAGSASIHGSLVCALRIAHRLGHDRPRWRTARERLARVLRHDPGAFEGAGVPTPPGRHSMDWYYPVLGGAIRGEAGRRTLLEPRSSGAFLKEGAGCRCVRDAPWYTVAETCELVLALHAVGLESRAREVLSWTHWQRTESGAYWTGTTHPGLEIYPEGEQTTWTAATVLLAHDAVHRDTSTSRFFVELEGRELGTAETAGRDREGSAPEAPQAAE
ncbi:MAG: prenyltransferase [Myxococcota bacterium]